MTGKVRVSFSLNGERKDDEMEPNQSLCDYLHDVAGTTSVKKGCDTGECGACTVLLDDMPVASCLVLAPLLAGRRVVSAQGLGTSADPHPVQQEFVDHDAVQCGYCIPGMVVTLSWIHDHAPEAPDSEVRRLMSGNLCRCTGYQQQIDALKAARERARLHGGP